VVAVVNQAVTRYFPGQNPIGKRWNRVPYSTPWPRSLGVEDVPQRGLDQDTPVQVYVAYLQEPTSFPNSSRHHGAGPHHAGSAPRHGDETAILNVDLSQPYTYLADD